MGLAVEGIKNDDNNYHTKQGGNCLSAFVPPILHRLVFHRVLTFSQADLHPEVLRLVESLSRLTASGLDSMTPAGKRMQVSFSDVRRNGDDLVSLLELKMEGTDVFKGSVTIIGAFLRGKIALAHSVMGAVEVLYHHLDQAVYTKAANVRLALGVVEVTGNATNPAVVRDVMAANHRREGYSPIPGFDVSYQFGLFPDISFQHFYGDGLKLVDSPLSGAQR